MTVSDELPDRDPAAGLNIAWANVFSKRDLSTLVDPEELKRRAGRGRSPLNVWGSAGGINNILCRAKYEGILKHSDRGSGVIKTDNGEQANYFRRRLREKGYWVGPHDPRNPGEVVFRV